MTEIEHSRVADNVLIALSYDPGFSMDLTSWKLTIDSTGTLKQTIRISNTENHFRGEIVVMEAVLQKAQLDKLLTLANNIGFFSLSDSFREEATDCRRREIQIRGPDNDLKTIDIYGDEFEEPWKTQVRKLSLLWTEIVGFAPFRKRGAL